MSHASIIPFFAVLPSQTPRDYNHGNAPSPVLSRRGSGLLNTLIINTTTARVGKNLLIRLVRHYVPEKTVRKGYRPAALIKTTLEHVASPDTFMTFFLSYIYEDLCSDEGLANDCDIARALLYFEGFSSWEPEQINKLNESLEKFAEYIVENFLLPRMLSPKSDRPETDYDAIDVRSTV